MNKDQFLNTGLLEQYALGLTDEEESKEVEKYLKAYPELQEEVDEIRKAVESYAMQHAIPPHPRVKSKVMSEIKAQKRGWAAGVNRWLAAGMILSFAGLIVLMWLYSGALNRQQNLKREFAELQIACDKKNEKVLADLEHFQFIKHKDTKKVALNSISKEAPLAQAVAFWNPQEEKAFVNLGNLPEVPSGMQYQIWADVDHVMISVGLLDNSRTKLQAIDFLAEAESLNITIEPRGGSQEPTVEQLIVSGKI